MFALSPYAATQTGILSSVTIKQMDQYERANRTLQRSILLLSQTMIDKVEYKYTDAISNKSLAYLQGSSWYYGDSFKAWYTHHTDPVHAFFKLLALADMFKIW